MFAAIDAHVHVWTDDRVKYPRAEGEQDYTPAQFTPEDLFRHSKPAGVTRVVLIQMSFYRFDNSYMLDSMKAHPGVFSGVGIVNDSGSSPDKEMEALARKGVRGFRIVAPRSSGDWLGTPGMNSMWATGAKRISRCVR